MAELNDIVQIAVDAYHGNVVKYSVNDSMKVLREALIEANGNSTKLDYKRIRDGKCAGLFTLVEEILARTVTEGLQGDEFFNNLVEYRNVALGDQNIFDVEDSNVFEVAEAADGTQAIRRQRLTGSQRIVVPTTFKVVKIYDELNRVLSGQVDFNKMIAKVGESFRQKLLTEVQSLWASADADDLGSTYYPAAGAYDEDTLLDLIEHVEAAAGGKKAVVIGTKKSLRKLAPSIQGADSRSDLYNLGYYGNFYGTPVVSIPQRHKVGTTEFVFADNALTIMAGDEKPIKVVNEGEATIILGDMAKNQDLTQDYLYGEKWGMKLVMAGNSGIARYVFTNPTSV